MALAIAVFIGYNAARNFIGTIRILLQSVPGSVNIEKLSADLHHIYGVQNIHDLHVWSIDGIYDIGSLHAVVNTIDGNRGDDILSSIPQVMEQYKIQHPAMQIEINATNCKLGTCIFINGCCYNFTVVADCPFGLRSYEVQIVIVNIFEL